MIALSCGKWQMKPPLRIHIEQANARRDSIPPFVCAAEPLDRDLAHPRHDAHAEHDVDRVGDFEADLGQRRIRRPHDVGNDEHGAPAHRAFEHAV